MKRFSLISLGLLTAGLLFNPITTIAQGFGGGGGQRGQFDPEQMRERMAERMKEVLNASDEEFKVIRPLLEDVQDKQRAVLAGRMGGAMGMLAPGRAGAPGRPGADAGANQRPQRRPGGAAQLNQEAEALSQSLESESTPAAEIRAKLQALREARAKSEAELKQSQEKLRAVLTTRQEAQLVLFGLLP